MRFRDKRVFATAAKYSIFPPYLEGYTAMKERQQNEQELDRIEAVIRSLEIAYEKYFMGIERIPPEKERADLGLLLRRMSNRHIVQVDLRFRFQTLSTRYHSLCGNWDRVMRQIEEGKYVRQLHKLRSTTATAPKGKDVKGAEGSAPPPSEADRIYQQLAAQGGGVDRSQVADFLARQREALKQKLGGREVEFIVVTEDGKPKIKARPKG